MTQIQEINLSIVPGGVPEVVHVKQYDAGRIVKAVIHDESCLMDLSDVDNVEIELLRSNKTSVVRDYLHNSVCLFDYTTSTVTITITQTMTEFAGGGRADLVFYVGEDKRIATATFVLMVEKAPTILGTTLADEVEGTYSSRGISHIERYTFSEDGYFIGDVTGDKKVNNADLMAMSRLLVGLDSADTDAGDIDCNGVIDNADMAQLVRLMTHKPTDWNIIKLNLFYTDNTCRTVYMFEKFDFATEEEIVAALNFGGTETDESEADEDNDTGTDDQA